MNEEELEILWFWRLAEEKEIFDLFGHSYLDEVYESHDEKQVAKIIKDYISDQLESYGDWHGYKGYWGDGR